MESIIVSLVSMALIVVSTLAITLSTFQSANKMADAWRAMEERSTIVGRTEISAFGPVDYHGGVITATVQNDGHVNLKDFGDWDVLIQHQSGSADYLTYAPVGPADSGRWTVEGIFVTGGPPEVFDPDILNPGEYMILSLNPNSEIGAGEMARILISTPNGVTTQCYVTRN